MRVILATPPEYRQLTTPAQVLGPPIGLLYIASYARHYGYLSRTKSVLEVFDAFTLHMKHERFVKNIVMKKPDVLGVSVTSRMFPVTMASLEKIHAALPETRIVLGGIHPTFMAENIVKTFPFVDCVIKGEAERSFSELLISYSDNDQDISHIRGITALRDDKIIDSEPDTIMDIDEIPFPARDLVEDISYGYTWNGLDLTFGKFTSIVTGRGCPFACNFCTNWRFSNRQLRIRSVENVVSELELLKTQGYGSCVILDDIFTADKERVKKICEEIKRRDIDIVLYCEGRVDTADPEMFRNMKEAGFSSILFGVESGSQKILDYYQKHTTPAQAKIAVANAKAADLLVIGAFIIGAPVETIDDLKETLAHISELDFDALEVNALGIAPWDMLYVKAMNAGKVGREDWMRDHLVSDYYDNLTKEDIAKWVEKAYYAFFRTDFVHILRRTIKFISSRDGRNAIVKNLMNPYLWRLVLERGKPRHKIEEILMLGTETMHSISVK
ncbi:Fe-S oxidoreductase [Candidatus Methanoperedens nitroreducens]|uniref:Fe-S oxidoreductase n=1 Tax=Candidatus Methanoperedens nitratireducens TaxID=1392998 RepID=A0A062V3K2_9EURY|nr:radical SAM protein [Candidatus Methanoperedens nitroreducens]KCZ71912.1 Fe-S oxidoreductase [Candidatus Methanoperedens nitroreducens]MDJ1422114.1 radical SAM protein [Candidatus Methanoperedens sp.]